jgi:Uma2 family endonuclease
MLLMKTTELKATDLDLKDLNTSDHEAPLVIPGVTEEDYYSLDHDIRYQYLGGDLVREPVGFLHDDLNLFLAALLRLFVEARGGAVITGSRVPMRLDPKWSPEPDIMVIRDEWRRLIFPKRLEGPADLVIEILSDSHPEITIKSKLPRYREARVPEIWTIDPYSKSVRAEILAAGAAGTADAEGGSGGYETRIMSAGRLSTAALPGFWVEVAWLWQEPLPTLYSCLRQILA